MLAVAAFWLSSSLLLDFLMMPMMYGSGMMNEPGFASAGYGMFWLFNRVELLCAAAVLSGLLALRHRSGHAGGRSSGCSSSYAEFGAIASGSRSRWALIISGVLLAIALTYTYFLTPQMSALGLNLSGNFAEPTSHAMSYLHGLYWGLEAIKLLAAGWLIKLCYRDVAVAFE